MATYSSGLAWRIPGMGEPGGLPSMGSHRVGHDWSDLAAAAAAALGHLYLKQVPQVILMYLDTPLQYSCLENPMDGGAWWAAFHGVAKSRTWLCRLHFHFSLSWVGEGNGNPLQCSCLENPRDGEAWWAAVYGVTQSRTGLKWLSSSRDVITDSGEKIDYLIIASTIDYHMWKKLTWFLTPYCLNSR